MIDDYIDALGREAAMYAGADIDTVFLGGGTPSVLSAGQLERLLAVINSSFKLAPGAEFSAEINPGTLSPDKIGVMINGGVNRASIGVQSFDGKELRALGRIHTAEQAAAAVEEMRAAGIKNINIDIMTSIPYQTRESLMETLKTAVSLPIDHISAYSLILEEGTPLFESAENGEFTPISDDEDRDNYDMLADFLSENGFERYEISNFAKPGYECRHNVKYWECREYIGLGAAAHSYLNGRRFYNVSELHKYIRGEFRENDVLELSAEDMASEFMIMGLRMTRGVGAEEFSRRFGRTIESVYGEKLEKFIGLGLMKRLDGRYFLTRRGMDISNSVMCEFII